MHLNRLTREKLQRGRLRQSRCKAGFRLQCVRLGQFRLLSRHHMRGRRYWGAPAGGAQGVMCCC